MTTHVLRTATLGIAMPKIKQGWVNKKPQGGHAPVPYRQRCNDYAMANKFARVPMAKAWLD